MDSRLTGVRYGARACTAVPECTMSFPCHRSTEVTIHLTSNTCIKQSTTSPTVLNGNRSRRVKNGRTIMRSSEASGTTSKSSKGMQWLRGSVAWCSAEKNLVIATSCGCLRVTLFSMTILSSEMRAASMTFDRCLAVSSSQEESRCRARQPHRCHVPILVVPVKSFRVLRPRRSPTRFITWSQHVSFRLKPRLAVSPPHFVF